MKAIRKSEYTQPTPVQAAGVPAALSGRDLIGNYYSVSCLPFCRSMEVIILVISVVLLLSKSTIGSHNTGVNFLPSWL